VHLQARNALKHAMSFREKAFKPPSVQLHLYLRYAQKPPWAYLFLARAPLTPAARSARPGSLLPSSHPGREGGKVAPLSRQGREERIPGEGGTEGRRLCF